MNIENSKENIDVVLITVSRPILLGVYKHKKLFKNIVLEGQTSDVLEPTFRKLIDGYNIQNIIYVNTPGSFLSIKLSYIFLRTLSITNDINLMAVDAFYFNNNQPIKAIGNRFFIKKDNKILLDKVSDNIENSEFILPNKIDLNDFSCDIEPDYILPSV